MIYNDDCIKIMTTIPNNSIDMIFADPPYFLSNNGLSISSGKVVCVNKGEWDKKENYNNVNLFTNSWLKECYRIMKQGSTIWVCGSHHNIFNVKKNMDEIGFKTINIIIWHKINPPPLIYKNKFKFSYECIIWASKGKNKTFNYNEMFSIDKKEMHDVWNLPSVKMDKKIHGYHPTQKPECLLERIILSSTNINDVILDPFMGSGTTGYVSKKLKRSFIGIEKEEKYYKIAKSRIESIK